MSHKINHFKVNISAAFSTFIMLSFLLMSLQGVFLALDVEKALNSRASSDEHASDNTYCLWCSHLYLFL